MSSSLRNVILILAFAILLPVSIFIALELSSLSENEEILENTYREQLDAIIFTVNQYAAELLDFYIKQLDHRLDPSNENLMLDSLFIQQNLTIQSVSIKKTANTLILPLLDSVEIDTDYADSIFHSNKDLIERLVRYKQTGYIKLESLGTSKQKDVISDLLLIIVKEDTPCLVFLDPFLFIEDLLAPKIQQISDQVLKIAIFHVPSASYAYGEEITDSNIIQSGGLTLLEDFEISVTLLDQSIDELIQYRTQRSVILLIIISILMILGLILVIVNVRKELRLSKAKSDFVANVSHEIRTPLALISMFNETLLYARIKDKKKIKEYYRIIHNETARLNNIVNKILSFSQIDAKSKTYQFTPLKPDQLLKEVIDSYSYHLHQNGFTYSIDLEEDMVIQGDREAIVEIVINLIDNAIKYSKEVKKLTIRSFTKGDSCMIEIIDKGIGVAKKDQKKVFDKFFRAEGGNVYNTKGTGLGLSLVDEIMKAHGGKVELESQLGQGSTFRLIFTRDHEKAYSHRR